MNDKKIYMVDVPAKNIPTFRYQIAQKNGIKQIMMTTWGGLGDQVCAEPTLRYAFELFPDYEISLLTSFPELFHHLPFKRIIDNKSEEAKSLNDEEWLVIHTYHPKHSMTQDFLLHHYTQCVDFSSLCAFQRQLPINQRQIMLFGGGESVIEDVNIVIHPGRHWQSKTFPKWWWDEVIKRLSRIYSKVVIIGKDIDENTGTVDVEVPENCIDLRNKLSLLQLVSILKNCKVVLTNDSAPLHIASAGIAQILYVATCKDSEYLTHWRFGEFGWGMQNLSQDGLWLHQNTCPIRDEPLTIDTMPEKLLKDCLPSPNYVIEQVHKAMQ